MQQRRDILALSLSALSLAPAFAQSAKPSRPNAPAKRSVFGLITPRSAEATLKSWTPFLERMSMYMGQTIEPKTYAQQGELVEDFKKGLLDYAWVGNVPAIELAEANLGAVFGQLVVKGQFAYRSLLITPAASPIKNVPSGITTITGQSVEPSRQSWNVVPGAAVINSSPE